MNHFTPQRPVILPTAREAESTAIWADANKDVIWGWKRDVETQNRAVYFSATLGHTEDGIAAIRHFFNYRAKIEPNGCASLLEDIENAKSRLEREGESVFFRVRPSKDSRLVEFKFGVPTEVDQDRIRRLALRRPRRKIPLPVLPDPVETLHGQDLWPADVYVGSGISYEAGLPTLCDMHDVFCVDNEEQDGFTVGASDQLPKRLAQSGLGYLDEFCQVHTLALRAEPTPAMRTIAEFARAGKIGKIFTDNVDNLLSKTGAPYERVRGSGVFNERYPAQFTSPRLIVIGVAADRRQIVRQARAAGLEVIVVNPCKKVSPNVMHLEYVRPDDVFFKWEAEKFFHEASV